VTTRRRSGDVVESTGTTSSRRLGCGEKSRVQAAFDVIDVLGLEEEEKVEHTLLYQFQSTEPFVVGQATCVHTAHTKQSRPPPRTFRPSFHLSPYRQTWGFLHHGGVFLSPP
jgi:hypothetical protein